MLFSFFMNLHHEWRAFLKIFHWGKHSIPHNTDLIFNIRVLSVSLNSICFSVYSRKKLMSIQLVHIKQVYELLSSWPRDQTHITSISCTGRQVIYRLCHLEAIYISRTTPSVSTVHDQSRTKNIGRTVLISQGTVILGTLVITGTSQFLKWWGV